MNDSIVKAVATQLFVYDWAKTLTPDNTKGYSIPSPDLDGKDAAYLRNAEVFLERLTRDNTINVTKGE